MTVRNVLSQFVKNPSRFVVKKAVAIGKFRIPQRSWDEIELSKHDCEANAGQLLGKNKRIHWQIAAESLENDRNHENNKISELKGYQ